MNQVGSIFCGRGEIKKKKKEKIQFIIENSVCELARYAAAETGDMVTPFWKREGKPD